jgi:hypothetical protein
MLIGCQVRLVRRRGKTPESAFRQIARGGVALVPHARRAAWPRAKDAAQRTGVVPLANLHSVGTELGSWLLGVKPAQVGCSGLGQATPTGDHQCL